MQSMTTIEQVITLLGFVACVCGILAIGAFLAPYLERWL